MTLLEAIFGCRHTNYTFPLHTEVDTYVCCLECGKEFEYSWERMKVVGPRLPWKVVTFHQRVWEDDAAEVLRRWEISQLERLYNRVQ